jgi:predicted transcriptional regulator
VSNFEVAVEHYMNAPAQSVTESDTLETVRKRLEALRISSLAVVNDTNGLAGVISMTDLIRVGRIQAGSRPDSALLTLPNQQIHEVMSREVVTVGPKDPISLASRRMLEGHIHRVYVMDQGKLIGVLTTRDLALAIRDKRVRQSIEEWMSTPVFTVRADEPVSVATERLVKAHVTGLVVLEDDWPIGLFTQREALRSMDHRRETHVDQVMSSAMLVLNQKTPLHRAAGQVAALHVRRVVAIDDHRRVSGILTGADFARVTADA